MASSRITPKVQFILMMLGAIGLSLIALSVFEPVTRCWWIFQRTEYPLEHFGALAFIIGASFVILITNWYKPPPPGFDLRLAVMAFGLSGTLSILISLFVLYPLWELFGFQEVKTGWWIFASSETQPKNSLIALMAITGAIAGPVEELAKLAAVLLLPSIRRQLRSPKFALYSVLLCAFGFAMIENVFYFAAAQGLIVIRANPAHAVFSALWGLALGRWYAGQINLLTFLKYLSLGMGLHALWNIAATTSAILFLIVFGLTSWKGLAFIYRELSRPG